MEFTPAGRHWSLPLALQIVGLLLGGLIVAQLVTLVLTLLLPPEPPTQYGLDDIARALGGKDVAPSASRPLQRVVQTDPPQLAGPGWLTSDRSRHELAVLLGRRDDEVQLWFYTPLPFAGSAGGPARGAALDGDRVAAADRDASVPRLVHANFLLAQAGPPPGGPGGRPDGGPPRSVDGAGDPGRLAGPGSDGVSSGRGPRAAGGPGGAFPGGADRGVVIGGGATGPSRAMPGASDATGTRGGGAFPRDSILQPQTGGTTRADDASTQRVLERMQLPGAGASSDPAGGGRNGGAGWTVPGRPSGGGELQAPSVGGGGRSGVGFPGVVDPVTVVPYPAASSPTVIGAPVVTSPEPRVPRVLPRASVPSTPTPTPTPTIEPSTPKATASTSSESGRTTRTLPATITPIASPRGLFGLAPAPFVEGDFVAALRIADGWAVVQPVPEPFPNAWQRRLLLWFAIAFALIAPLGWWFARRVVQPIAGFARAAERLGRDPTAPVMMLKGPAEVGRAAHAFNRMQSRLRSFVDDRTAMIGAISHDLRTPLTRLRFRLEDVDEDLRAGMLHEVEEMEAMITSVLAFIRDASEPGSREKLDLAAIVEDVVEDAVFVGNDVRLTLNEKAPVEVDAIGMRRLLANLVENAVKYGDRARVRLFTDRQEAVAEVSDDGPGLSDDELERVFQPFYRAQAARASDKQGTGLGLAVCRSIARAHGGDVQLMRGDRGLVAQVRVPLAYGA